jgi:hypothetical protein
MQTRNCPGKLIGSMAVLLAVAVLLVSCGGGSSSIQTYVGTWTGTTSQGVPLSFVVQGDNTVFCFSFEVIDSQFRSLTSGCDADALDYLVIENHFSVNRAPIFTARGTFLTQTTASGTIRDTADVTPINLEWTASKQ